MYIILMPNAGSVSLYFSFFVDIFIWVKKKYVCHLAYFDIRVKCGLNKNY